MHPTGLSIRVRDQHRESVHLQVPVQGSKMTIRGPTVAYFQNLLTILCEGNIRGAEGREDSRDTSDGREGGKNTGEIFKRMNRVQFLWV